MNTELEYDTMFSVVKPIRASSSNSGYISMFPIITLHAPEEHATFLASCGHK